MQYLLNPCRMDIHGQPNFSFSCSRISAYSPNLFGFLIFVDQSESVYAAYHFYPNMKHGILSLSKTKSIKDK